MSMTLPPSSAPLSTAVRALVVEPDAEVRRSLSHAFKSKGWDVADCADVQRGRELFEDQRVVVAPLNGDNTAMKEFVAWVRAQSGSQQPWIIGLGPNHVLQPGETADQYGVNDLVTGPVDTAWLVQRLEALGLSNVKVSATQPVPPLLPGWDAATGGVLLEQFPAAVAIVDRDMRYLTLNRRWRTEFQIPEGPVVGWSHYDVFPDLHPDWTDLYQYCLEGHSKQCDDDKMERPDGTVEWVRWQIHPWRDATGGIGGLVLTCAVVTREVETAARLADAESRAVAPPAPEPAAAPRMAEPAPAPTVDPYFREVAEAAPFGMVLLSEDAEVLYANPQHRAVLGFDVAECGGMEGWLSRGCASDESLRKRVLAEWWDRVWSRRASWVCSMKTAEGIVKDVEFRPAALSGDRMLLTIFDVTDSRLEEANIRASEARYRGLFQGCAAGVVILSPTGNITEVNPAFEKLTGCSRLEVRRSGLQEFLPVDAVSRIRRAATGTGPASAPALLTEVRSRAGKETVVALSFSLIRAESGAISYIACYLHPLTRAESSAAVAEVHAAVETPAEPAPGPWGLISPDTMLELDADGTVLQCRTSRDFPEFAAAADTFPGQAMERAMPAISECLPLEEMMERLADSPEAEIRCEFTLTSEATEESGPVAPRTIEARMVALPEAEGDQRFGLALRDLSASFLAREPAAPGGEHSLSPAPLLHLHSPVILTDRRGRITALNPAAQMLFGYRPEEIAGKGLYRLFRPDGAKEFGQEISRSLTETKSWTARTPCHHKDGTTTDYEAELVPVPDDDGTTRGFIVLLHALPPPEKAARPSVTLHRARNDFQVLSSVLTLQADKTETTMERDSVLSSRDRLGAVALVYRHITGEEDAVDFQRYAVELGRQILDSRKIPQGRLRVVADFAPLPVPQKAAISLGLILQELITAALRDSFPPGSTGSIRVHAAPDGEKIRLTVSDDGTCLTTAQRTRREQSFSWQLITTLASQLHGDLTQTSDPENSVSLNFRG